MHRAVAAAGWCDGWIQPDEWHVLLAVGIFYKGCCIRCAAQMFAIIISFIS